MRKLKVRMTLVTDALGTASSDINLYDNYIAAKNVDTKEEEVALMKETLANQINEDGSVKPLTIFPKNDDGKPIFYDYQIRGFFKEACASLREIGKTDDMGKASSAITAYKKKIDGQVFVRPRQIPIELSGPTGIVQRSLRTSSPQGERTAIASSESVPAGSTCEFEVLILNEDLYPAVIEWLNYGIFKGMGQWRSGGNGSFEYEILEDSGATKSSRTAATTNVDEGEEETSAPKKRGRKPKKVVEE